MIYSLNSKMELFYYLALVVLVNMSGENCDLGGNTCQCSDDMSFLVWKDIYKLKNFTVPQNK